MVGPGEDGRPRRLRDSPLAIATRAQAALESGEEPPAPSINQVVRLLLPFPLLSLFQTRKKAHPFSFFKKIWQDEGVTEAIVLYQMALLKEVNGLENKLVDLITDKPDNKKDSRRVVKEKSKSPFMFVSLFFFSICVGFDNGFLVSPD